ncbi:ABC transporter substrate-binding protein [Ancylobacter lacus]|uniref:ABC transporter substrate-binding protein n=1 Tax=Ancylobacter lacus TaxID=2579970 RepID=UPI001BCB870C|nr:extracellular solute-binding protein [Ancylobacter lacus]MBS7538241.1 extracellular solute-binding protein [Ancylobacter lacus]
MIRRAPSLTSPSLSRRDALRHAGTAALFAALAGSVDVSRPAYAGTEKLTGPLNVLAWAGYDDPELMKGFTEATGVELNVKEADSNGAQLDLVRAGTVKFDVINPDAVWTAKFARAGLTLPIDPASLPSMGDFFPMFRNRPETMYEGKLYGVPTRFGVNGFVYWPDKISPASAREAALAWDPALKERVEIIDWPELYLWMAGLWLGMPAPETATGPELQKILDRMIAFRPNMRALQADMGTVKSDLVNREAWMVWGASSDNVATTAKLAGANVELTIPDQGGAMWMETLQIVRGTEHLASALAYVNYMTSAKAAKQMAWGADKFAVTNAKVMELLTAEQVKILGLDKIEEWASKCRMSQAPVDEAAWADAWQRFKTA